MSISNELAQIETVFIDTAPVIYYIEAHPQFGPLADDFVRGLYRRGILNDKELEQRLLAIEKLKNGELKPEI